MPSDIQSSPITPYVIGCSGQGDSKKIESIRINLKDLDWSQICPRNPGFLHPWIPEKVEVFFDRTSGETESPDLQVEDWVPFCHGDGLFALDMSSNLTHYRTIPPSFECILFTPYVVK